MKYGESTFDIIYLLFAVISGIVILIRRRDQVGRIMGSAALILGAGDAFHLIPRVLNYFAEGDLTAWLGYGKLITSITMTVFYVLLFVLHTKLFVWNSKTNKNRILILLLIATTCRVILCLLPGNNWSDGGSSVFYGTVRNITFVMIGVLIAVIYYQRRNEKRNFKRFWLYITLSFLFYIPVAVGASLLPLLGMLMLGVFLKEIDGNYLTLS